MSSEQMSPCLLSVSYHYIRHVLILMQTSYSYVFVRTESYIVITSKLNTTDHGELRINMCTHTIVTVH